MVNSREPIAWITVKGARVPIFDGQSKEDAVKEFRERIANHNRSNQPITQGSKDKAKRDYSSAKKQAKRTERRQDEEGNRKANERLQEAQKKYNDTKEKTGIKSTSFGKKEDAIREKLTDNRARILKASPEERKNIVREDRELQSKLDRMQEQKNITKNEDEKEKQIARNEAERRALTKHEKLVAQARDNKRRREQGIETKYGAQDHTKLDQHPDIKKMAEDFNKDVWTREGGVRNGELYDKARAWAKEHNYNEEKAVKAAMRARDDDYVKTHQRINEMANKKYGKNYSDLEDSQRKEIAKSAFEKQTEVGKYDKYKSGYRYENAKTVNVNGNEYKVWSDDTYRGTFAEDKNGNVLPIKKNGYLSNEVSQRKAIANTFKESSFRSKAVKENNKTPETKSESLKTTYDESKAKSYKITTGGLNRASQAAADTMGQSLFKNGKADIVIKEENARDTIYSLRDKNGNEVGTFLQARTAKKGTGKLTLYGVKTTSEQKTNSNNQFTASPAEQAYMNAKAIKISKNMPKEKQEALKKQKAEYMAEYKRLINKK